MRKLFFILMFSLSLSVSSEETISRWMADYFKRIHDHIGNENYEKAQNDLKEFRTYLQKDICVALGELDETQSHNNKSTYVYIKGKKQVSVEVSYVEPSPYYRRGAILFGDAKAEA